ncbi:Uncharacterized protein dnm_038290 [Desulfonema magnum]|uniref:Uncharacterized protein n=1 Tax=Desulfonema magnum TaxID=45655 RepID=A0A975GNI2_9BACT|nr:Uncharacterized protein dnm_038290 [Desulfonema magnum]
MGKFVQMLLLFSLSCVYVILSYLIYKNRELSYMPTKKNWGTPNE